MRSISARSSGVGIVEVPADDHEIGSPPQPGLGRKGLDEARHSLHIGQPADADHERQAAPVGAQGIDRGAQVCDHRRRSDGGRGHGPGARKPGDLAPGRAHRLRVDPLGHDVVAPRVCADVDPQQVAQSGVQVGPREQHDLSGGLRKVPDEACPEPQRAGRVGRAERGTVELARRAPSRR